MTASKRRQLILWFLSFALWYTLCGFFVAPRLIKAVVLWQLPKQIGRPVALEKIKTNPFAMSIALDGFAIAEHDGTRFVGWDEVYVNVDPTGLFAKEIVVAEIVISNAFGHAQANKDGTFNFSDILKRFPSEPTPAKKDTGKPMTVRIGKLRITGSQAVYDDFTRATPFHTTVGPIDVTLHDFSTDPTHKDPYAFTAITEAGENLSWSGHFYLDPLRSDGKFVVENIKLKKYAPFYDEFVNLTLHSGALAVAGNYRVEFTDRLTLAQLSDTTVRLDSLEVAEAGQTNPVLSLANLSVVGINFDLLAQTLTVNSVQTRGDRLAVRKLEDGLPNVAKMLAKASGTGVPPVSPKNGTQTGETPVPLKPWRVTVREVRNDDHLATVTGFFGEETNSCQSLRLTNLRVVTEPLSVTVDNITVIEPRLDVVLPASATNLFAKRTGPPTNSVANKPASPLPFVQVGDFVVSNAASTFTDQTVQPTAALSLSQFNVLVTGFSTDPNANADFQITGQVGNRGSVDVSGRINPLNIDAATELRAILMQMDLTAFGPYSGKYAGYDVRKGKLTVGVKYSIEQRQLNAQNSIVVDQFTFGDKVDSPAATKLPVRLAVAILKDRTGKIELNVPIEGRVDDPQFRYWGAVWSVLGNLFTKIFTAPFSMLGSMFGGGGEELSYQEFAPGSSALQSNETKKLDVLIKALTERPALSLEITGSIDPSKDVEPLQRHKLRVLAAQRLGTTNDYAAGLRLLYADALPRLAPPVPAQSKFKSNVNNIGATAIPPVPTSKGKKIASDTSMEELERQYLPLVELTPADYRQLTAARTQNIAAYLKEKGQLTDDRLFIATNSNAAVVKEGARVIFGLQ